MLNHKSILITGGTGSLGKELTKTIFEKWPDVKRLVIFSRDEQKQFQMAQKKPTLKSSETAALEKALLEAQLKIKALNTLIDVAEDQLKIDIRKKSGAKRS
jgi:short-subunit dehydrogenase involved in D-alanine esterification of teichoic acids